MDVKKTSCASTFRLTLKQETKNVLNDNQPYAHVPRLRQSTRYFERVVSRKVVGTTRHKNVHTIQCMHPISED